MKTILRQDSRDFPGHVYGQVTDVPLVADYSFGVPKTAEDANGIDCTALSASKAGSSQSKEPYDEPDLWQNVPHSTQGADPRDTMGAMVKRGLKRLSDGLYDTRWVSYFRADLGPADASANIKRAMTAANSACTVATPWYRNWIQTVPGGVLPMGDSIVSNHDYLITGWDAEAFVIDAHLGYVLRMPFDVMNKVLSTWGSGAYIPSTVAINAIRSKTLSEAVADYFVNAILQIKALINQLNSSQPMTFKPRIVAWAKAIATWEGAKPSLNNPGNMKYSSLTASWGATPGPLAQDGGRFSQFSSYQQGFDALCNFLTLGCENQLLAFHQARTFEAFTKVFAGNPPQGYIEGIRQIIGCSLDTDISAFLS